MGPLQLFFVIGGPWLLILGAFVFVARAKTPKTPKTPKTSETPETPETPDKETDEGRFAAALSQPWFGAVAAAIAAAAVSTHFMRLWSGLDYVPLAGDRTWLHTAYGLVALVAIGLSLYGYHGFSTLRPWLSFGLVMTCVIGSNVIARPAPKQLSQADPGDDPTPIAFIQKRLIRLGCFEAVHGVKRVDGNFDASTAFAVIEFQDANARLDDARIELPFAGIVRPTEFRLLSYPFPWLEKPHRCGYPAELVPPAAPETSFTPAAP